MASENRRANTPLEAQLFQEGYRFDFFQAVRLLRQRSSSARDAAPADPRGQDCVRFRARLSLAFPPSAIHEIRATPGNRFGAEMTVAFMGLTGPMGVLPHFYTELLLDRVHAKDTALRDFLDLLNHRLMYLFYEAWEKHHCAVGYERSQGNVLSDRFTTCLLALMGLGTPGLPKRLGDEARLLLRFAGLLARRPRSAHALERCLADHFRVPVRMKQFRGAWLHVTEEDQTRLGDREGRNVLGQTAVLGTQVWDQQAEFGVVLGPLPFAQFYGLLPSGDAFPTLLRLIRFFAGPNLDFDVQLVLKHDEVPTCLLAETKAYAPRLGWTSWLKTVPFRHDAADVRFSGGLAASL